MEQEKHGSSFSSFEAYGRALVQTPNRVLRRACSVSTTYEEMTRARARSGSNMQKSLRWFDLIGFGLGGMIGAGVFVTTGRAAKDYAGPAVLLSYAFAGFCALLSAFCYTEFAVDMPVAGGAFTYIRVTFGEFAAFFTGANLVIDYVLSNAAISRGFTAYLGMAIGITTDKWRITVSGLPDGFNQLDFVAVGVILIVTICICYSTKESSLLNIVLTILHIVFILFIIIIGFMRGDWENFVEASKPNVASGFFPYGVSGVFNGAAMVYLSYIGYDSVSTMAEEVRSPRKDIPIGISGSVVIVTLIYCLMAASMSKLVPYDLIDIDASFASAFRGTHGWGWVSNVIGVGASFGILTSIIVSMMGQSRYLCVIGRSNVIPSWFAKVNAKTSTPVNATASLGILTAILALFTELDILLDFVTIGTLFVFYMVANAVVYRRHVKSGVTKPWSTLAFLLSLTLTAIIFALAWQLGPPGKPKALIMGACIVTAFALVVIFQCVVPQVSKPQFWGVPLMPWTPSISIFLNVCLLGSLNGPSYIRFGVFTGIFVLVYLLYSVHASFDAEEREEFVMKEVGNQRYPIRSDNSDELHV